MLHLESQVSEDSDLGGKQLWRDIFSSLKNWTYLEEPGLEGMEGKEEINAV